MIGLSKDELWRAVSTNDAAYDGRFYYGVTTTRVFCRPSCKSKQPRQENVVFFASAGEANRQDYRPCKRCRPDIGSDYRPDLETVRTACRLLEEGHGDPEILRNLPRQVGLSRYHLSRLFKEHMRLTPKDYLQTVRVDQARHLLAASALSASAVCFEAGFNSMSSFYKAFRAKTGLSPRQYRASCGRTEQEIGQEERHG